MATPRPHCLPFPGAHLPPLQWFLGLHACPPPRTHHSMRVTTTLGTRRNPSAPLVDGPSTPSVDFTSLVSPDPGTVWDQCSTNTHVSTVKRRSQRDCLWLHLWMQAPWQIADPPRPGRVRQRLQGHRPHTFASVCARALTCRPLLAVTHRALQRGQD